MHRLPEGGALFARAVALPVAQDFPCRLYDLSSRNGIIGFQEKKHFFLPT
jgi:hypothetical protein